MADSRIDLARSGVALGMRTGNLTPDIGTKTAIRKAAIAATSLGLSTGPSAVEVTGLFGRWGASDELRERIVTAQPGAPVGSLVASGKAALGFQQLSELKDAPGIAVLGLLPPAI